MKSQMGNMVVLVAALSVSTVSTGVTVAYDASDPQTSYADGAVAVTYDGNNAVTAMSVVPAAAAGGIEFSGDAMVFSPVESVIALNSTGTVTFANAVNVSGNSPEAPASIIFDSTLSWTGVASMERPSASASLLAPGVALAALTNLSARFSGTASGLSGTPTACFLSNNGRIASCQFQLKTSSVTLRAITVELTQGWDGVYARVVGYGHISYSGLVEEVGDVLIDSKIKETYGGNATWTDGVRTDCYVTDLAMAYDVDVVAQNVQPRISLASANALENVDMVIGGEGSACVEIAHAEAFPASGSVTVSTNSRLSVVAHRDNILFGVDNGVPVTVLKGGVLEAKTVYAFSANGSHFVLDGGTLAINSGRGTDYDSSIYIHDITFRNGANVTGGRFRIRADSTTWKVEGESPSFCESGILVWTYSAKTSAAFQYSRFEIEVDDIADGTDFFLRGPVNLPDIEDYRHATLVKSGTGTMSIGNAYAMTNMATRIEGGTFLVDGDWLHPQCPFALAGGTFAVAAGSSNSCGTLTVESASVLSVADGASLSFADSSGSQAWNGILTVDADLNASAVRFGTGKNGLSGSQKRKIRTTDGKGVLLDETGRLCPAPSGFVIGFR